MVRMVEKSNVSFIMILLAFIVGLTGTMAVAGLTIPLWQVPPGTLIRPMFLIFVQLIISLATAVLGTTLGITAWYFASKRRGMACLAALAIFYSYTPMFVGHAISTWMISVHHLVLDG